MLHRVAAIAADRVRSRGRHQRCDGVQLLDLPAQGRLMWFVPRESSLTTTRVEHGDLHLQQARHPAPLLPECGIHPFGEGTDPKGNRMAAVNLRCLTDVDVDAIPVSHYDGRSK